MMSSIKQLESEKELWRNKEGQSRKKHPIFFLSSSCFSISCAYYIYPLLHITYHLYWAFPPLFLSEKHLCTSWETCGRLHHWQRLLQMWQTSIIFWIMDERGVTHRWGGFFHMWTVWFICLHSTLDVVFKWESNSGPIGTIQQTMLSWVRLQQSSLLHARSPICGLQQTIICNFIKTWLSNHGLSLCLNQAFDKFKNCPSFFPAVRY